MQLINGTELYQRINPYSDAPPGHVRIPLPGPAHAQEQGGNWPLDLRGGGGVLFCGLFPVLIYPIRHYTSTAAPRPSPAPPRPPGPRPQAPGPRPQALSELSRSGARRQAARQVPSARVGVGVSVSALDCGVERCYRLLSQGCLTKHRPVLFFVAAVGSYGRGSTFRLSTLPGRTRTQTAQGPAPNLPQHFALQSTVKPIACRNNPPPTFTSPSGIFSEYSCRTAYIHTASAYTSHVFVVHSARQFAFDFFFVTSSVELNQQLTKAATKYAADAAPKTGHQAPLNALRANATYCGPRDPGSWARALPKELHTPASAPATSR
jgi:hypothetical protein